MLITFVLHHKVYPVIQTDILLSIIQAIGNLEKQL